MSTESPELVTTGLVWGVKQSFVRYVSRMPGSDIRVGEGTGFLGGGEYYFEVADTTGFDAETTSGVLAFRGSVEFSSHFGILSVSIADPWIEFGPDRTVLSVAAAGLPGERIPLVVMETRIPTEVGAALHWEDVPTVLADGAAGVFDHVYAAGVEFDPVSIRIARG